MANPPHDGRPERGGLNRRGVTPAVSKSLEVGMVVLFVALLTTVLLGGVVPDYRGAVDARVGDRVLATASAEIERAVPPSHNVATVETRQRVTLPARIGDKNYELRVDGRALVLDHPDPGVSGRTRLVLPDRVDSVAGRWQSGTETMVVVEGGPDALVVRLTAGGGA
jgi:hypothetical protein